MALPTPRSCSPAAARDARVGAGLVGKSTSAARPTEISVAAAADMICVRTPHRSGASAGRVWCRRVTAVSITAPVMPLPIAASVNATSTAASRIQASDSTRPKPTKPTTAANA